MRKLSFLTVAMFLLLGLRTSSHATTVTVDANLNSFGCGLASPDVSFTSSLVDTGIDVNVGDSIAITAVGMWRGAGDPTPFFDADGGPGGPFANAPELKGASLLGQIGDVPLRACDTGAFGRTFFVGKNFSGTASQSGRLFLAFCDTDFGNNQGAVTANVTVTPAPEPPVAMTIQGVIIDRRTGKFEIKGIIDVTDPAFDNLVTDPSLQLRMELETQGSSQDPFGIVGEDEVPLTTKKKELKFQAK